MRLYYSSWAVGGSVKLPYTKLSIEGMMDFEQGDTNMYFGDNMTSVGVNYGQGKAWVGYVSYTWLLDK